MSRAGWAAALAACVAAAGAATPPPTTSPPGLGCDPTCLTCSSRFPITAVPCSAKPSQVGGFAFGAQKNGSSRSISHTSALVDGCVGWNRMMDEMQVFSPCAAEGAPSSWTNSSSLACQRWLSNASSELKGAGFIGAGPGCLNNENAPDGCLDIHSKVGPRMQLTKCYGQPNDNFTISAERGIWRSEEKLPDFPARCMEVTEQLCSRAACCTSCPPGRHLSPNGFCLLDAPPQPERKVFVFLAITTNATAVDEAIAVLALHRSSFTGVIFQYLSICGAGNNDENRCAPSDAVGPAHLAPGNMGGDMTNHTAMALVADLPLRLRKALGDDLEVLPIVSVGGTQNITMMLQLFNTPALTDAFIKDALGYAEKYAVTGFNWDLEPFGTGSVGWQEQAQGFLAQFSAAFRAAGFTTSWDANGLEGVAYDVDSWVDMSTYYSGDGYKYALERGLYGVSAERYGLGYCPTCQLLTDAEVDEHFTYLRQEPGKSVREIYLWSFYGTGMQPPLVQGVDVWKPYWPNLEAWLKEGPTVVVAP